MSREYNQKLNFYQATLIGGLAIILALMPFHGLVSVSLGKLTGQMGLIQAWKEALILGLTIVAGVGLVRRQLSWPKLDLVNLSILLILLASFMSMIIFPNKLIPTIFSLKTNLAPLITLFLARLVAKNFPRPKLINYLLYPAVIVSVLAILQYFVIPVSWLNWLGYGSETIRPIQLVDPALNVIRVFSTLGGPNQLGAYLILPLCLALTLSVRKKQPKYLLFIGLIGLALILTFSRSSWLGVLISLVSLGFIMLRPPVRWIFVSSAVIISLLAYLLISPIVKSPENSPLQYILLHGRIFDAKVEGSDANRPDSLADGVRSAVENPLGQGLGSAGPASFQSDEPVITENWFLQIALELGWLGLAAYLLFFIVNIGLLWTYSQAGDILSASLLAALFGVLVANLFLHSWTDSTLGLVFFTALGLVQGAEE